LQIAEPQDVADTVFAALKVDPEYHVCLGGGTRTPLHRNTEYFIACIRLIRRNAPDVPIWVEMTPPGPPDLRALIAEGATSFGFNLEVWDERIRQTVARKAGTSRQGFLDSFELVADALGPNRVGSCLIVGLEPEGSTILGAAELCRRGVQPCLLPFKPWNGSKLSGTRPCEPDCLLRASEATAGEMARHQVRPELNQGCLQCEGCTVDHDVLSLVAGDN